ncbi:unnamed protein product [Microthlaspi erraticum]|uniref:Uncharacterized protein n=1 Tax=Microthlaspi erraticum TaxID=1685480 RepID=A0A6D2HJY3_9BRAS|nr:unnamed protein product [Microthlaspi erraticum]
MDCQAWSSRALIHIDISLDFLGNLKKISIMRSVEIVSEFSSFAFVGEVEEARETDCHCRVSMALWIQDRVKLSNSNNGDRERESLNKFNNPL